jgi:hypothetical protein
MGFLLRRQSISLDLILCAPSRPFGPYPEDLIYKRPYLHCPAGPSHVDDDVVELLLPPLFCVVDVVVLLVVHPGLSLQVLPLPPWPLVVVVVVVVVNPVLFPLVLSARATLAANANEPQTLAREQITDVSLDFLPSKIPMHMRDGRTGGSSCYSALSVALSRTTSYSLLFRIPLHW